MWMKTKNPSLSYFNRRLIPGLICMVLITAFKLPQKNVQIVWGTKTLTWDDFQGKYNRKSSGIASTYSYMDMDIEKNAAGKPQVELRAVFDKEESWVIYKEKTVLTHERGHFDITELYARKLRKKISETRFSKEHYKIELWNLYKQYDQLMDKYHDQYDDETESSMDIPQQKAWEASIKKDIEALDAYKGTTVELKLNGD